MLLSYIPFEMHDAEVTHEHLTKMYNTKWQEQCSFALIDKGKILNGTVVIKTINQLTVLLIADDFRWKCP